MDILYDSQIFMLQRYGGISRYFYELIQNLIPLEDVFLHVGINGNDYGVSSLVGCKKKVGILCREYEGKETFCCTSK